MVTAAVEAGAVGWPPREGVAGAAIPKENPPPVAAAGAEVGIRAGAGAVVAWTLAAPKLNPPPKDIPPAAAIVAAAAAAAGWGWTWA